MRVGFGGCAAGGCGCAATDAGTSAVAARAAGGLPKGSQGIRVDVDVFYQQITATGVLASERSVRLSSFLSSR